MKITTTTEEFSQAIRWVTKTLDTKNQRDAVILEIDTEGAVVFKYANDESFIEFPLADASIDSAPSEKTQLPLSGAYLSKLGSVLSKAKDTATLKTSDNELLITTTRGSKFYVPIMDLNHIRSPKTHFIARTNHSRYFTMLQKIRTMCDSGGEGAMLAIGAVDISFHIDENKENVSCSMFATDRFAMSKIDVECDFDSTLFDESEGEDGTHYIIPHSMAGLVPPSKDKDEEVDIVFDDEGKYGYVFENGGSLLYATKNAKPINSTPLLKKTQRANVEVIADSAELQQAINSVSALSYESSEVTLAFSEGSIMVSDDNNSSSISVECESSSRSEESPDDCELFFTHSIISEAFQPVMTKKVSLAWNNETEELVVIRPVLDNNELDNTVTCVAVVKSKR